MARDTDTIERIFSEARQRVGAIVAQGDREDIDGILHTAQERAARVVAELRPWEGLDFDALAEWGGDLEALADWDLDFDTLDWDTTQTDLELLDLATVTTTDLNALSLDDPDDCPLCGRRSVKSETATG